MNRKFLGFSLFKTGKGTGIRSHAKSIEKIQEPSMRVILINGKKYTVGWLGYYTIAEMSKKIKYLNEGYNGESGKSSESNGRGLLQDSIISNVLVSQNRKPEVHAT